MLCNALPSSVTSCVGYGGMATDVLTGKAVTVDRSVDCTKTPLVARCHLLEWSSLASLTRMPRRASASRRRTSISAFTLRKSATAQRFTASRMAFSARSGKGMRSGPGGRPRGAMIGHEYKVPVLITGETSRSPTRTTRRLEIMAALRSGSRASARFLCRVRSARLPRCSRRLSRPCAGRQRLHWPPACEA
jgi:hypothetical protein